MKRIDQQTVQRILDTADIVEVVSDFVTLKRRGANYIGLCPFHNERTPSFSVSKSKGICKCFSCGKGGSAVNFIMELEQLTFNEALRYLAKKYNIPIEEKEETSEERQARTQRESLFAVNEFALGHFTRNLTDTADGRDIGLPYFRERGINDEMIAKFHLGYALNKSTALYDSAVGKGFNPDSLVTTGLVIKRDDGSVYDRFKGRVIYPVHTVSGRVVAFGGRTLRTDKTVAKYVNSPESDIYSKSNQLYGLFQAKQSIAKADNCILVEGYMDVISMHQIGICNVVASSGTSLTENQIRLLRRFSKNVTLIYDADPAGIKASLRGVKLLLAEGMTVRVLLLPEGDDPDTFAQSHTKEEVEAYIAANSQDFIRFITDILLKDAQNDPIRRAAVINDILAIISEIPDQIARSVHIEECSRIFGISQDVLVLQTGKMIANRIERLATARQNESAKATLPQDDEKPVKQDSGTSPAGAIVQAEKGNRQFLYPYEKAIAYYLVKYGVVSLEIGEDPADGSDSKTRETVVDIVADQMSNLGLEFTFDEFKALFEELKRIARDEWSDAYSAEEERQKDKYLQKLTAGRAEIAAEARSVDEITRKDKELELKCREEFTESMDGFASLYTIRLFSSHPDDRIRNVATDVLVQPHKLSKVHTKTSHIASEIERLSDLLVRNLLALQDAHIVEELRSIKAEMQRLTSSEDSVTFDEEVERKYMELIKRYAELISLRQRISKHLGERTITIS